MSGPKSYLTPHFPDGGRLMVTNGGAHPPDMWAQATAEHIAPLGDELTGHRRIEAMALQAKIIGALEPHYTRAQETERTKLRDDQDHLISELDPAEHVEEALQAIRDAAAGTQWEAHFQEPEVSQMIRSVLMDHFRTAQHIERGWHVDRNPDHSRAATFNAMRGKV